MPEQWRLLLESPTDGATNMARDEALARGCAETSLPILRLYRWSSACLSLGRFQPFSDSDSAACRRDGVEVVRRASAGRAMFHGDDLSYAVIVPAGHPIAGGSVSDGFCAINHALVEGLNRLGVPATISPCMRVTRQVDSPSPAVPSPFLFDTLSDNEVVVDGRKLVGSVQMRLPAAVMQHGSLPLTSAIERLRPLLAVPPVDLGQRMTSLDMAAGRAIGFEEVAQNLAAAFADYFGIELVHTTYTTEEVALASQLRNEKYATSWWTERGRRTTESTTRGQR